MYLNIFHADNLLHRLIPANTYTVNQMYFEQCGPTELNFIYKFFKLWDDMLPDCDQFSYLYMNII